MKAFDLNQKVLVWVIEDNTWRKGTYLGQSNLPSFYNVQVTDCHSSAKGLTLQVTKSFIRTVPPRKKTHRNVTVKVQAVYDTETASREIRNLLRIHKDTFMSKRSTELL